MTMGSCSWEMLATAASMRSATSTGRSSTSRVRVRRRLRSSRFSTRPESRSASSSMVSSSVRVSSGPKLRWSESKLDEATLMAASGVRRSWPTAANNPDPSCKPRTSVSAAAASSWRRPVVSDRGQLGGKGGEDLTVPGAHGPARQGQHLAVGEGHHRRRLDWSKGWLVPDCRHRRPSVPALGVRRRGHAEGVALHHLAEDRRRRDPEGERQLAEESGQRVALRGDHPAGGTGQHPGVGPGAVGRLRAAGGDVDQHTHDAGRQQEHDQCRDVTGVSDGEGVDGRAEVPIEEKEAGHWSRAGPDRPRRPRQ